MKINKEQNEINVIREIAEEYYEATLEYHTEKWFLECVDMTEEEFLSRREEVIDIMCDWVLEEYYNMFNKLDKYNLEKYLLGGKNMKTLKELNQILEENRLLLKDMMIDYCIDNPDKNVYLYIDINTGETFITGIKEQFDTEIYVDYFEGFDFDDEITTAMCLVNELELVEKYGIEKEYEEAREDLERGNYAFGDFLCEVGKLGEFKDEVLKEIEEDYYIADISEEEYFKTLKRLEDK